MSAVGVISMVLGILCLFLSYRIRIPEKFDISKISPKKIKAGTEKEYRMLYSTFMLINGIMLSAYGFIRLSYPEILTFEVKMGVVFAVVIVNELLRVLAKKYYADIK